MDLKGYVKNASGSAKSGLTVQVYDSTALGTVVDTTTTDANGMWTFTGLDTAKTYAVRIVDGLKVLWVDGRTGMQLTTLDAATISSTTISEHASGSGVTVDGCLIKDGVAAAASNADMVDSKHYSDISGEIDSDITTHAALTTGVHGVGAGTIAKTADITATKIDDLTAGDDNTDLDASTAKHGLVLKAVAPAAGLTNVVAIENGETVYKNKALFDATNPAALGTAGTGSAVTVARRDHVHTDPVPAHAALTTVHGFNISEPVAGDILYFNATTGRWERINTIKVASQSVEIRGKTFLNMFTAAGGELEDWPNAALSIRRFDDFTDMKMLQFGHRDDNPYQTGDAVWNFYLHDNTGSKLTSDSSTDLVLGGPGIFKVTSAFSPNNIKMGDGGIIHGLTSANWIRFRGGVIAAGGGAGIDLKGVDNGDAGAFYLCTPDAAGTGDVIRLGISGKTAIANIDWYNSIHRGFVASGTNIIKVGDLTFHNTTNGVTGTNLGFLNFLDLNPDRRLQTKGILEGDSKYYIQNYYYNGSTWAVLSSLSENGALALGRTTAPQGKLWIEGGDIWINGNDKMLAFTTDDSTDNSPNVALVASSDDLVVKNWSGSALVERFRVKGNGAVIIASLPTSDPAVAGQLWNSSGTVKISAG